MVVISKCIITIHFNEKASTSRKKNKNTTNIVRMLIDSPFGLTDYFFEKKNARLQFKFLKCDEFSMIIQLIDFLRNCFLLEMGKYLNSLI